MFWKSSIKRIAFGVLVFSLVVALVPASAPAARAATTLNFAAAVNYSVPAGSDMDFLATGDFNQDGHPDLVTADNGTTNLSVLRNNGNGTFASAVEYDVAAVP